MANFWIFISISPQEIGQYLVIQLPSISACGAGCVIAIS
jgi:hypothetical protein